jgi:hypothetical protein
MAIYVKFAEESKPKTVREFLHKFFSSCKDQYLRNVTTYSDKECKILQCKANKYRSFDDIFELVKTYYPTVSIGTIFRILLTLNPKHDGTVYNLYMMSCSKIQKINCLYVKFQADKVKNYDNIINQPLYDSNYTYEELFDMIGVKNQKNLDNILKL